jgi:L-cysteate sulfo-lyase
MLQKGFSVGPSRKQRTDGRFSMFQEPHVGQSFTTAVTSTDSLRPMPEERFTLSAELSRFPRLGLAHLPTPLEPMKRLTEQLGGPRLWVKREDATGVAFGGNKLRKLDYVLHEAMAVKADTLVSGGVVQSNSQRQVAAAAATLGLECHLAVYHGRLSPPTPEYETSGNAFLNRLFGAHLYHVPWTGDRNDAIQALGARLRREGRRPYFVPYGVSNALGASAIVHCTGSAATQAGLVVGASIALKGTRVIGIDIDAEPERVRVDVVRYANAAADLLEASFEEEPDRLMVSHILRPSRRLEWGAPSKLWCSIRSWQRARRPNRARAGGMVASEG